MRDLPRKLTRDELVDLFQAESRLVDTLADREDPLEHARDVLASLPEEDRIEALNAHPRIGETGLRGRSAAEQGAGSEDDPALLAVLGRLNTAYEERFGFRFVVFLARRARADIVPVLRARLQRGREEELETGCDELVAIAVARWRGRS